MRRLLIIIFIIFAWHYSFSQNIVGNWGGDISAGGNKIPIVFHFYKDASDKTEGKWDSPSQNAKDLPCGDIVIRDDSVLVNLPVISGSYKGKFVSGDSLAGMWIQHGFQTPLNLARANDSAIYEPPKRPQTPKPPFSYISDSVLYTNADSSVKYGATFTRPFSKEDEKFPAVLLITGSGKQDRDETIYDHKPFAVIADYLTKHGIAVLRVDDRGMGQTTGAFDTSSSADFAGDVEAGIQYLLSRNDVEPSHIGLLGHSEGGMIAPMVAAKDNRVSFVVLLAGPGVSGMMINDYQNSLALKNAGIPDSIIQKFLVLHDALVSAAVSSAGADDFKNKVPGIYYGWKKDQSEETVNELIHGTDEQVIADFEKKYFLFHSKWWRFFLTHDPSKDLEKLSIPVLALNGSKDMQVDPQTNLAAIRAALKKSQSKNYKVIELPGLNHLFQHCTKCTVEEYGKLEETIAPEVLRTVSDWINSVVK
ncbi:MAG TPA: alpha/beta hydrolase [Chitinophagaceae bacterium]|nr:alpha/beta hydrolase [Chitinophagaceae bacterium]